MASASCGRKSRIRTCCPGRSARPRRRPKRSGRGAAPTVKASEGALQLLNQIQPLPGGAAGHLGHATETSEAPSARVDWLVQAEMCADAARREIHYFLQHRSQPLLID